MDPSVTLIGRPQPAPWLGPRWAIFIRWIDQRTVEPTIF
jgi:hypothetical protein